MTKKYIVYNPITGANTYYDTKEQALDAFWAVVVSLAKFYNHNSCYTVAEIMPDGSEKWYNENNDEIDKPRTSEEIQSLADLADPSYLNNN